MKYRSEIKRVQISETDSIDIKMVTDAFSVNFPSGCICIPSAIVHNLTDAQIVKIVRDLRESANKLQSDFYAEDIIPFFETESPPEGEA